MKLSKKLLVASFVASVATAGFIGAPSEAWPHNSHNTTTNITNNETNNTTNNNQTYGSSDAPIDPGSFSLGMSAPTSDVGKQEIEKGTITYSSSVGQSDQFSVGTSSAVSASANIAATPDYKASATANFEIGKATSIQQTIGQGIDIDEGTLKGSVGDGYGSGTKGTAFSANAGTISGNFQKTEAASVGDTTSNKVGVSGIGSNAQITMNELAGTATKDGKPVGPQGSAFTANIEKDNLNKIDVTAGTASGGASGVVNTSTSASAASSQFVSSFVQAY